MGLTFLFILLFPVIEIYLLFKASSAWGFAEVLTYCVIVALIGFSVLRREQDRAFMKILEASRAPFSITPGSLENLASFIGGLLLLIPGFMSDVIALVLLIPLTRRLLFKRARKKFESMSQGGNVFVKHWSFGTGRPNQQARPYPPDQDVIDIQARPIRDVKEISASDQKDEGT